MQTIYVDQIHIIGGDDQPSPVPSPMAPPVAASTAAPVAAPAAAPEATDGTGVLGSAVYVERVGNKGVVIISAQADGTPLVVSARVYSICPNGVVVNRYRMNNRVFPRSFQKCLPALSLWTFSAPSALQKAYPKCKTCIVYTVPWYIFPLDW